MANNLIGNKTKMKLLEINESHFKNMLKIHDSDGGNLVNESLSKLFDCMNDESNRFEVSIKVAALNQLYSTAIQYITPVVNKIVCNIPRDYKNLSENEYAALVDRISTATWVSPTTDKNHSRTNLSFASKYIHFLSNRKIPIYDSYIWIVMIGYLKQEKQQEKHEKYSFNPPENYEYFYQVFTKFKERSNLQQKSNYGIDKFLWQYGKNILNEIIKEKSVGLNEAKSVLKKRITSRTNC